MAAYFWVGGTGTWDGTGNTQFAITSGGVATLLNPTNADTVTFDANSGTAATVTVTSTAVSLSTTINKSDINLSLSGSPTLCTAAGTCTLTTGTITLNTFTLTIGSFSSNNTNARTITFGTGNITVTGVSGTVFGGPSSANTGLTITGTAQVNVTGNGTTTRTVNPGNSLAISAPISFTISAGSDTINSTAGGTFNNLTFTSGFTGTFGNVTRSIFGNLTLDASITSFSSGASTLTFTGTGSRTITTAGETIDCPITFNGVGGTWQLQDALTSGDTRTCTLINGTLDLNDYTLTTGIFSSSNSNVRTLTTGVGNFILTGNNATIWNTSTSTNLTYTNIPFVDCTYAGAAGSRTITTSATTPISANFNSGTDNLILSPAFQDLDFQLFGGTLANSTRTIYGNLTLWSAMTTTAGALVTTFSRAIGVTNGINGDSSVAAMNFPITLVDEGTTEIYAALVLNSTSALTMTGGKLFLANSLISTVGSFVTTGTTSKYLGSITPGTAATISAASGTNTVSYLTIQDSYATGGATWDALAITNVDAGNNTGWLFSTTPSIGNEITMRLRSFTQPRRF